MANREKVIKHFTDCVDIAEANNNAWVFVRAEVLRDALELLKDYDTYCKWLAKDIMENTDPEFDYYNPEVVCRKLYKMGYVEYDKEENVWRVNDGR